MTIWKSENTGIAKVDGNGNVTGVAAGTTTIDFYIGSAKKASQTVKVSDGVAIYRLYLPANGEHLFTPDANEATVLKTQHGWNYEGVSWYAPATGSPVYRLYNPGLQNHLYTTDTNEVSVLTTRYGWQKDNGGNPLFYSGGSVGIYRLYNYGLRGMHLLTTDSNEYKVLPGYGWKQEGTKLNCLAKGDH